MSKKSNAVAKVTVAEVIDPFMTIVKTDGKESGIALSAQFRMELFRDATETGGFIQTVQQKIQTAMNASIAFKEYKRITKSGLPGFAKFIDPTVPHSTYGAAGSKERREMNAHTFFTGLEYLVKKGNTALLAQAERKALSDAGINPDDSEKVGALNKTKRDNKAASFESAFCKCMVDIARHGVTATTIENIIVQVLKKKEKTSDDPNDAGIKLRDAAVKAVLEYTVSTKK